MHISALIKKVFLEYSHAYLSTLSLWLCRACKSLKYLLSGPSQRKLADPDFKLCAYVRNHLLSCSA